MFWATSLFFACKNSDYSLYEPSKFNPVEEEVVEGDTTGETEQDSSEEIAEDTQEIEAPDEVKIRFDASIQRMKWGGQVMRCQIQLAFTRRWYPPPESGAAHEPQEPPEGAGDCAFYRMEDSRPEAHDNWYISGDLFGPEEVYLYSEERTIPLELVRSEDGLLRYEMRDCSEDSFPFEEVFDLEIPSSVEQEWAIPASYIEAALVFGPDLRITSPYDIPSNHQYQMYASDGLDFSWEFLGDVPDVPELDELLSVWLTNNRNQPWDYLERMNCLPDSRDDLYIPPSELTLFTLNDYLGQGEYGIGLNIHADYHGPERIDP
ncbi:MAG: hypothetical protein VX278_05525, partial [Myxococcota bacterium]|nr:hypothetical protein [Myxococcota bacterium]